MSSAIFTLPSFAKINWTLHVLGRRADGYHDIRTIFQTITLHDTLSFAPAPDEQLQLTCNVPGIPTNETNLIHRAARALQQRYGISKGAFIGLDKRIPAMGGLGGGSSNAAVALLGLTQLWKLSPTRDELMQIGATLGADVPFFFVGGTALGTGLGTEVTPLDEVKIIRLLIVTPDVGVSTAEAYQALDERALTKHVANTILFSSRADDPFADSFPEDLHNDFEAVVFRLEPEIERVRDALVAAGARQALMTGSGASVFGVFDNEVARQSAMQVLESEKKWRVFECQTFARAEYLKALGSCGALLRESS